MRPDEALSQIRKIRGQLARSEVYRGVRALTVLATAGLAFAAALAQPLIIPRPELVPSQYALYWCITALAVAAVVTIPIIKTYSRGTSQERAATRSALCAFLPPLGLGALVTGPLVARGYHDLLPGLWALFTAAALFATRTMLPRATGWVALAYAAAGALILLLARGSVALEPWVMGGTFTLGQAMAAAVLYWNLERGQSSTLVQSPEEEL